MKNKKNKMKLLYMIPLFVLVVLVAIVFRNNKQDVTPPAEDQVFTKVDDYHLFFGIDNLVNDYIDSKDSGKIDNYFYSNEIYHIKFKFNEYFLVVGEKVTYNYDTTKLVMTGDVAYLINNEISNKSYGIEEVDDYKSYLTDNKLYDYVYVKNSKPISKYIYNTTNDLYIMNYYINYFKELLFINYTKAYQLLDSKYKSKVGSLDDFNIYREQLYGKLNNIITDYSIKGDNGEKYYQIILSNGTKIDFQENSIMNFNVNISNIE